MNIKSIVQERQQAEPYIIVGPSQAFLVDYHVIGEVKLNKIPCWELTLCLTFAIARDAIMFSYLEVLCLDANASKISQTVKHLIIIIAQSDLNWHMHAQTTSYSCSHIFFGHFDTLSYSSFL